VSVCLSVCLSGYAFPQFSTDLLQMLGEPSTGHDTFRGLYMLCVHATCGVRVQCARTNRMRMFSYRHCVLKSCLLQTVERILSKFAGNVLLLTISVKDYLLFMFTHRAHACVGAERRTLAWVLSARVCVHSLIF
jgi:hypothetical protein